MLTPITFIPAALILIALLGVAIIFLFSLKGKDLHVDNE
jgi:hypothetical protein